MSNAIKTAIGKLPAYWKLATIRCSIYAFIVAVSAFDAGVEGYDNFHEMTFMQVCKLLLHIVVAIAGVWVAFLDQSMSKLNGATTIDTLTLTHAETKPISPAITPEETKKEK